MGAEWDTSSEEDEEPSESEDESFEEVERPSKKKPAKPAEEEEEESSDEESFEEVERPRPKKGAKAPPPKKADSSDGEESDSDEEEFEEVERPSKKKPAPKKRVVHEVKRKSKKGPPKAAVPEPAAEPEPEPEPVDPILAKEFLSYSNFRLLPGGSCHKSDVVASFRQHFPQYDSQDAVPDEKIERVLDDWYGRKIRLNISDGNYEGFHLNPKFLDGEAKERAEAMGEAKKAEPGAEEGETKKKKKVSYLRLLCLLLVTETMSYAL